MKKLLLSLAAVIGLSGALMYAATTDNTADFNTFNNGSANTAYSTYTTTDGWTAKNCCIIKVGDDLAPTLNGKTTAVGVLTSPTLTGGIGTLTFSYMNNYSETNGVSVRIDIKQNGNVVKTETLTKGKNDVVQGDAYTYTSSDFNVEGNFVIEITNLSPSYSTSNKDRVSIWNLSWTSYGDGTTDPGTDPNPGPGEEPGDDQGPITITTDDTKAASSSTTYVTTPTVVTAGSYEFMFDEFNPNGQMRTNQVGAAGFNLYNITAIEGLQSIVITTDGGQNSLGTWYAAFGNTEAITASATATDTMGENGENQITFTVPEGASASYFHLNLTEKGSGTCKFTKIEIYTGEGGGNGGEDPDPGPGTDPEPTPGESVTVTYDATAQGYQNAQEVTSWSNEGVTITFDKGTNSNTPKYYTSGTSVRVYGGGTMTVAVGEGDEITEITLEYGTGDGTNALKVNTGNWTSPTWTGNAESVTFTVDGTTGHKRIKTVTVTYTQGEAPSVAMPSISCENNEVTITCATEGATIYYTLDGSEPSNASTKYTAPFSITETKTVKAIAYDTAGEASAVATYTANYVGAFNGFAAFIAQGEGTEGKVNGPITAVYQNGQYLYVIDSSSYPMLVYGSVGKTLANGDKISDVSGKYSPYNGLPEMTNPTLGTVTTGGTPIEPQVKTASQLNAEIVNTYIKINDITINGADKSFTDNTGSGVIYTRFSDVDLPSDLSVNYDMTGFVSIFNGTIQIYPTAFEEVTSDLPRVETPTFSPDGGAVLAETQVEISCATDGATIYYTTDGSEPTDDANVYSAPITVTEAMTIKAIAIKEGMETSKVATASFTILDPNQRSVTFDFTQPSSLGDYTDEITNGASVDVTGVVFENGVISLTTTAPEGASASSSPRFYCSNTAWSFRFYNGNEVIISAQEGYKITSIDIDGTNMNNNIDYTPGSISGGSSAWTWTPDDDQPVNTVTFAKTSTGNNPAISTITVNYDTSTGVAGIEAEEGEAIYYNLQGVRVARPERGIFVKVQGGKAKKVLIN